MLVSKKKYKEMREKYLKVVAHNTMLSTRLDQAKSEIEFLDTIIEELNAKKKPAKKAPAKKVAKKTTKKEGK